MNIWRVSACARQLNSNVIKTRIDECVHYPYARTNGASHRRVTPGGSGRRAPRPYYSIYRNVNSPSLLVTILY